MSLNLQTNGFVSYGDTVLNCTNIDIQPGQATTPLDNDGYVTPTGAVMLGARPLVTFNTLDVATLLANISLKMNGLTSDNVTVYLQATTNEGVRGSSTNTKYVIALGALIINSISVAQGQRAEASCTVYGNSSTGFADPSTVTEGSVSLPSTTPQTQVYTLGSVALNSNTLSGITGWTLNLGNNCYQSVSDGNLFATYATLLEQKPTVSIQSVNPGQLYTLLSNKALQLDGTNGLALALYTTTNSIGTNTVGNTLTIKNGLAVLGNRANNQGQITTSGLTVTATYNLTNDPVVIS